MNPPSAAGTPPQGTPDAKSSLAADAISAKLAPGGMAEPAQNLLAAIGRKDVAELEAALRAYETKVMQDPVVAAYGGRWLLGVAKNHLPGLPDMIRNESLLGEMKGGGEALAFWVAQSWAATEGGYGKLSQLAEAMVAAWKDVRTDAAVRFGCALTTSLAVIQTKVAATLMSRIESVSPVPKGLSVTIEHAAAWVDAGCILARLSPPCQLLLEERLAHSERVGEWTSPVAKQTLQELRPHLSAPSKAAGLFESVLPDEFWTDLEEASRAAVSFAQMPTVPMAAAGTAKPLPSAPPPPPSSIPAKRQALPAKKEPVRLLVLVTILFVATVVYSVVTCKRQGVLLHPVITVIKPQNALQRGGWPGIAPV